MNTGKTALGILAGIATGALLGILFAPDSGTNTRKKIVRKGEGYVDDVKDKFSDLLDSIKQKYEDVREDAEKMVDKEKGKYAEARKEFKNIMS